MDLVKSGHITILSLGWGVQSWTWAAAGTLHLMRDNPDGSRMIGDGGSVAEKGVVETFRRIKCDGGDW